MLAAEGTFLYQTAEIEAVCPPPAITTANSWSRMRITAPTNDLSVQYFVLLNGVFVNVSAAQQSGQGITRTNTK